jgi:myo-inositol 2-dehydrogenase / D-chiro-inositol 1-dehydrogenase
LDDGIAALAMAEAATQSVKTGMPVKLADVMG